MCVYPSFGYKCQQNCTCEKDMCDFVRGCQECKYLNMCFIHCIKHKMGKDKQYILIS